MECKDCDCIVAINQPPIIGIYPEWNVKPLTPVIVFNPSSLEYIQNGM